MCVADVVQPTGTDACGLAMRCERLRDPLRVDRTAELVGEDQIPVFVGLACGASRAPRSWSADVFDDLDELVEAVAVVAGELDELSRALDDGAAFGRSRDQDAAPGAELEQSLPAQ